MRLLFSACLASLIGLIATESAKPLRSNASERGRINLRETRSAFATFQAICLAVPVWLPGRSPNARLPLRPRL